MVKKTYRRGCALRIVVGIMMLAILLLAGGAGAATLTVDDSGGAMYTKVQDAINASIAGDTILVYSGTYYETINVNNQITLSGVDSGSGMPIIDASYIDSAITLSADGIVLQGFMVINAGAGITVTSNSNAISENNILFTGRGIYLINSNSNQISRNKLSNNYGTGIFLELSTYNLVMNNFVENSNEGIIISNSLNNYITGNDLENNYYGIFSDNSAFSNLITLNNLVNSINAYDDGSNQWDDAFNGNHYSDFDEPSEGCMDNDQNGICDSSYNIPGGGNNVDNNPLILSQIIPSPSPSPTPIGPPSIISFTPLPTLSDTAPATRTFYLAVNQYADISWYYNGVFDQTNPNVMEASYTKTSNSIGVHNVTAVVSNSNGNAMQKWDWNVIPPPPPKIITVNKSTSYYKTIQAAINDANPGDEINVESGTYQENVKITKSLTIKSKDGSYSTIVQAANLNDDVFEVEADYVNISGFTIRGATGSGSYSGVRLYSSKFSNISSNIIYSNMWGIMIGPYVSNNTIFNNFINGDGTTRSTQIGIEIYGSQSRFNTITNNSINSTMVDGIRVISKNNIVSNNIVNSSGSIGIAIYAIENIVDSNKIINNGYNSYDSNRAGLIVSSGANSNKIYHNNFINNYKQANDFSGTNSWDNGYPSGGNYWSDYTGVDLKSGSTQNQAGSDGIGETPYPIPGGSSVDRYPLMKQWATTQTVGPIHNINKGTNYTTIQSAINDASSGDEIQVESGTYFENVNIDKRLILRGFNTGQGRPVIDAMKLGQAITLFRSADGSTIEGFNATNSTKWMDAGIKISSNNNIILNNTVSKNSVGIYVDYLTMNNTLIGNDASNNEVEGIYLFVSNNNTLSNNKAFGNTWGIYLLSSKNNTLSNNIANENRMSGICLCGSNNLMDNNNISYNKFYGIELNGNFNLITNNTLSNNENDGINVYTNSKNNSIINNSLMNNYYYGIGLYGTDNKIYHNYLLGNKKNQANSDTSLNSWDNGYPSGGNYWSDYPGIDYKSGYSQNIIGSDGIGDTPYPIPGGSSVDRYPLMKPYTGQLPTNTPPTTNLVSVTNTESLTPTINWIYSDTDGDPQMEYQVEVWTGPGGTGTNEWNFAQSSEFTTNSVVYSGSPLVSGKTYYTRVRAFDGANWGSWSETNWIPFERLSRQIQDQLKKIDYPENLLDPENTGVGAITWFSLDPEISRIYYEIRQSAMNYDNNRIYYAMKARNSLKVGDVDNAKKQLKKAQTYNQMVYMTFAASADVISGSAEEGMWAASTIKEMSQTAVIAGLHYNPLAQTVAEYMYIGFDYYIDIQLGVEEPEKVAFQKALITGMFNFKTVNQLGGKTVEEYIKKSTDKAVIPIIKSAFKSGEGRTEALKIIKAAAAEAAIYITEEGAIQLYDSWIDEQNKISGPFKTIFILSPGELRVFDSQGKITGLVNGNVIEEIPYSMYDKETETVTIYLANDIYRHEIVGTGTGTYGLGIVSVKENGDYSPVIIKDIPISSGSIHRYTIGLDSTTNKEILISNIDANGDGIFENTFTMQLPIASFVRSPTTAIINQEIKFDASSSDGDIVSYEWNFGDGTNKNGKIVNNAYSSAGIYTAILTIKDNNNVIDKKVELIQVISDLVPPTTIPILSGTPGNNGWYISNVSVNLTATDNEGGLGVNKIEYSFDNAIWIEYNAEFPITTEGTTTLYYHSTDNAGNIESTKNITISIDKTSPSITGAATTAPNTNGWYNTNVLVHFTASDEASGIDTLTPDQTLSNEGASQSVTGTATDMAGNSASFTVTGINMDKTAPVIDLVTIYPANTTAGSTINITVRSSDNLGVVEVTANGGASFTNNSGVWEGSIKAASSIGNYTVLIKARDAAGNEVVSSTPYRVVMRQGGASVSVSPMSNNLLGGTSIVLNIKIKNTQNIDDTFKVHINVSDLPPSYQANLAWFNWTQKVLDVKAGNEEIVPIMITVPAGVSGTKAFRAKANSAVLTSYAYGTGYLKIT